MGVGGAFQRERRADHDAQLARVEVSRRLLEYPPLPLPVRRSVPPIVPPDRSL